MVIVPLGILCILLLLLLLPLLVVGAGLAGGVVVHLPPGIAKVRVIQRRHQGAIISCQILQLIGAGVTLDQSGLLLVLLAMRAFAVGATCEIHLRLAFVP